MKRGIMRFVQYVLYISLCVIILYPLAVVVLYSFRRNPELTFSLNAYQVIFYSFRFQSGLAFSLLYAVSITIMQYIFGISGGFVLAKFRFKYKEVLYYVYLLCMIIPFNVIVLPQYMLFKNLRLYDTVWAIILPGGFGAMGIFFYRQFIKQIPNEIIEASQVEGASPLVVLRKILAPMLKDSTCAYIVICFCTNWNAIDPAIAFIRSADIQPLSIALKEAFINAPEVFYAPAVLYMIPPVLVYMFFSEELIRGLSFKQRGASHEK